MIRYFILLLMLTIALSADAASKISLELQAVDLPYALRLLAKMLHKNILIHPSVQGMVTLHLAETNAATTFDLFLRLHDLEQQTFGNIVFIAPHQVMQTTITTLPLVTKILQINYAKATELVTLLSDGQANFLSTRGKVRADVRTNTLSIQDVEEKIIIIEKLIKKLDIPLKHIRIEVRLVSIDHDCERALGLNFNTNEENTQLANGYSLARLKLANTTLLDVRLAALEMAGHAKLISSPSLFTENLQAASIEAGEEVPYQETSRNGATAVVFKKAVLGLKVTPQVLPGNRILLQLQVNQDRPSNKMVLGVPTISTRQMITTLFSRSGETFVLGGIYESNQERVTNKVPWISQLPIIGVLFQQYNVRENKRELLIFVTPKVLT